MATSSRKLFGMDPNGSAHIILGGPAYRRQATDLSIPVQMLVLTAFILRSQTRC